MGSDFATTDDRSTGWPRRLEQEPCRPSLRWLTLLAPVLIVIAGLAAYANSFSGAFIYDDLGSIVENPTIRQLWPLSQPLSPPCDTRTVTSRPLLNLSLAINYRLGGLDTWGYHATNLAIHLLNGLLLLGIVRRTLQLPVMQARYGKAAWGLALTIALLWTVHPLQTESVTYIVQRAESLTGFFYLLVLYSVIRGSQSSPGVCWYLLAVGAGFLGVGVKEVAVTAAVVVLLYDRLFLEDSFGRILRRRWGLYLGLFASWGLQLWLLARTGLPVLTKEVGTIGMWPYARSQPGVMLHYLRLSLWPHPLCLSYEWPVADSLGAILPGFLVIGVIAAATVWGLRKQRGWGFLGAWFFLILAPTSSIMPLPQLAFEHRMYLPLAAVVTLAVVGGYLAAERLVRRSWIGGRVCLAGEIGAVVLTTGVLAYLVFQRNEAYQSPLSIWEDSVAKAPANPQAHYNYGVFLSEVRHIPEAIQQYEQALRIKPDHAEAHNNLGNDLLTSGRVTEAVEHFQEAIRLSPEVARAYYNLGAAMLALQNPEKAAAQFELAVRLDPNYAQAHYNWGNALVDLGRWAEAIEHYQLALQTQPGLALAHNNWGNSLLQLSRPAEAIEHYKLALQTQPDLAMAHNNWGNALIQLGRPAEGIEHVRIAAQAMPQDPQVNRSAAWLMATREPAEGGDPQRAVEFAQRTCVLTGPQNIGSLDALAVAYASAGRFDEAVATAREAWQMAQSAGESSLAEDLHIRLQLYRDRKPYREPTVVQSSPQR